MTMIVMLLRSGFQRCRRGARLSVRDEESWRRNRPTGRWALCGHGDIERPRRRSWPSDCARCAWHSV